MHKFCFIFFGRSGSENIISQTNLNRSNLNTFDFLYRNKTLDDVLQEIHEKELIKIYLDTIKSLEVQKLITYLKELNYIFVVFTRSNDLKHYLIKKLQDNLIGEYDKDYKHFSFDENDYIKFCNNKKSLLEYFYKTYTFIEYKSIDIDKKEFTILKELINVDIDFKDPFHMENCKKFISNIPPLLKE